MIREVCEETETEFLQRLCAAPVQSARMGTLYRCYSTFAAVCRFYIVGGNAALAVFGGVALLCGALEKEDETDLCAMLNFLGVDSLEYEPPYSPFKPCKPPLALQGFAAARQVVLYRELGGGANGVKPAKRQCLHQVAQGLAAAGAKDTSRSEEDTQSGKNFLRAPCFTPGLHPLKAFDILLQAGLVQSSEKDGFYADTLTRRNHGFSELFGLYANGQLAATAGVYAKSTGALYLAGVAVAPAFQGMGLGKRLLKNVFEYLAAAESFALCKGDENCSGAWGKSVHAPHGTAPPKAGAAAVTPKIYLVATQEICSFYMQCGMQVAGSMWLCKK